MLDIALALLFSRALVAAAWRRFALGVAASALGLTLLLGLAASGWYGRGADGMPLGGAWILVILGPSAVPAATPRVPLSALVAGHPLEPRIVLAALFALPFAVAWRSAGRFSPLSDASAERKQLGLVFLLPALLLLGQALCLAFGVLAAEGTG